MYLLVELEFGPYLAYSHLYLIDIAIQNIDACAHFSLGQAPQLSMSWVEGLVKGLVEERILSLIVYVYCMYVHAHTRILHTHTRICSCVCARV